MPICCSVDEKPNGSPHSSQTYAADQARRSKAAPIFLFRIKKAVVDAEMARLQRSRDVALRKMLRCRVRYFTDGAVIGSRGFVDEVFRACRERFGKKRKDGARKWRGSGAGATGTLWSARDLAKDIGILSRGRVLRSDCAQCVKEVG